MFAALSKLQIPFRDPVVDNLCSTKGIGVVAGVQMLPIQLGGKVKKAKTGPITAENWRLLLSTFVMDLMMFLNL